MRKFFKKTDDFLARLSSSKYALVYLFILAFFEASISPILPEAYIVLLSLYRKEYSWKVTATLSALGSAIGASVVYVLGRFFFDNFGQALLTFFHGEEVFQKAKELFRVNAFYAQFFAALTPLPDRVFSLFAGAFAVNFFVFFVATFCGRLVRSGLTAYFFFKYGEAGKKYIKKHTKNALIVFVLFFLLYSLLKYLAIL